MPRLEAPVDVVPADTYVHAVFSFKRGTRTSRVHEKPVICSQYS